jgi:hypothetical protein
MHNLPKLVVFIDQEFKSSAEARIFENIFRKINEAGFDFEFADASAFNSEILNPTIIVGFSSDRNYREICKHSTCIKLLSICDIYSVSGFVENDSLYSGYIVPSDAHKLILSHLTNRPIFVMNEMEDPLFEILRPGEKNEKKVNVCWFGFPESFNKSMTLHVETISNSLESKAIDCFSVVTRPGQNINSVDNFSILPFDLHGISRQLQNFDYCILSHIPLDLHLNTLIKSPNKLISAIRSGLIPICSKTPEYSKWMNMLGFSDYLFDSPESLYKILFSLKENVIKDKCRVVEAQVKIDEKLIELNKNNSATLIKILSCTYDELPISVKHSHLNNIFQSMGLRELLSYILSALKNRVKIFLGIL